MSVLSSLVCSYNYRTLSQKGALYFNSNPTLTNSPENSRESGAGKRSHPFAIVSRLSVTGTAQEGRDFTRHPHSIRFLPAHNSEIDPANNQARYRLNRVVKLTVAALNDDYDFPAGHTGDITETFTYTIDRISGWGFSPYAVEGGSETITIGDAGWFSITLDRTTVSEPHPSGEGVTQFEATISVTGASSGGSLFVTLGGSARVDGNMPDYKLVGGEVSNRQRLRIISNILGLNADDVPPFTPIRVTSSSPASLVFDVIADNEIENPSETAILTLENWNASVTGKEYRYLQKSAVVAIADDATDSVILEGEFLYRRLTEILNQWKSNSGDVLSFWRDQMNSAVESLRQIEEVMNDDAKNNLTSGATIASVAGELLSSSHPGPALVVKIGSALGAQIAANYDGGTINWHAVRNSIGIDHGEALEDLNEKYNTLLNQLSEAKTQFDAAMATMETSDDLPALELLRALRPQIEPLPVEPMRHTSFSLKDIIWPVMQKIAAANGWSLYQSGSEFKSDDTRWTPSANGWTLANMLNAMR